MHPPATHACSRGAPVDTVLARPWAEKRYFGTNLGHQIGERAPGPKHTKTTLGPKERGIRLALGCQAPFWASVPIGGATASWLAPNVILVLRSSVATEPVEAVKTHIIIANPGAEQPGMLAPYVLGTNRTSIVLAGEVRETSTNSGRANTWRVVHVSSLGSRARRQRLAIPAIRSN